MVGVKQLEEGDGFSAKFVVPKQLNSLEGVRLPLYCFGSRTLLDHGPLEEVSWCSEDGQSTLDTLLLAQWEDRTTKGIFRYDVTTSEIKAIEGRKKFLAQLNEDWNANQLTVSEVNNTFRQADVFEVLSSKKPEELLFCVASSERPTPELIPSASLPDNGLLIIINASPVEYGHVLLVPFCSNSFYEFLDASCLEKAVEVSVGINNCCFRLFYDSSPDASHLHFQACYFPNPLAVELMSVDTIYGDLRSGMHIAIVKDYPVKTLLFERNHKLKKMIEVLVKICSFLQEKSITYNLLISDTGRKIFLFLQQQQKLNKPSILSAWECGGYFLFKSRSEFDRATEKTMLGRLSSVSIDDEAFKAVKLLCCSVAEKFGF